MTQTWLIGVDCAVLLINCAVLSICFMWFRKMKKTFLIGNGIELYRHMHGMKIPGKAKRQGKHARK